MDILMILRPELFSILIMTFFIIYDRYCARFRNDRNEFFKFALTCLGHCVMAFVTEITVNIEGFPKVANDILHVLFFLFSLLYSMFMFEYALSQVLPKNKLKKTIMTVAYALCFIMIIVMMLSPIDYIVGKNTTYSAGMGPTLCYALGFVFFIAADVIIIINRNRIQRSIVKCVLPLSLITIGLLVTQILIPEFLYTAQSLTITAVGLFFAIENPVSKFQTQAFIDQNAKIYNRNCYDFDLNNSIPKKIEESMNFTFVIADINGLKMVNDKSSHVDGDKLIEGVAHAIQSNMTNAYKSYRIGGDEFVALYFDKDIDTIKEEIEKTKAESSKIENDMSIPVGVSIGYAIMEKEESIQDLLRRAEKMMYENKKEYYLKNGLERRTV